MNWRLNKFGLSLTVPSLILGLIGLSACSIVTPQTTRSGATTADAQAVSSNLNIPVRPASQLQVVDSKGNDYLLIPRQTKVGKVFVESAPPYTSPARAGRPVRSGMWVDATVAANP